MAKINFDYIRNKLGILFFKLKKKKNIKNPYFLPSENIFQLFGEFFVKKFLRRGY